jgi:hypothetical protein
MNIAKPKEPIWDEIIEITDPTLRFDSILPLIPSLTIINKTLPGLGATYTEINALRNSIIVLPNVATIHNKHSLHKDKNSTFSVYERVTYKHVIEYIQSDVTFKKLLTTPESMPKVIKALQACGVDYISTYFILIDEAHKLISDVKYRPGISRAMDFFFGFKQKAMISSTPLMPSDPRFQGFKYLKILPTYSYIKPVELLVTNNAFTALKDSLERHSNLIQCVFINSLGGIMDIISKMGITEDAIIYCSKQGSEYISKQRDMQSRPFVSSDTFDVSTSRKFNFFTSSLFNGLDIIFDSPPHVIMVSVPNDTKTYLDPFTDVIQILGRFRTTTLTTPGYSEEAIHILPSYGNGEMKTTDEVWAWLNANKHVYDTILALMYANTNKIERESYKEALRRLPFHIFLLNDNHLGRSSPLQIHDSNDAASLYDINYFRIDNLFEEERVNTYYSRPANIWAAYHSVGLNNSSQVSSQFNIYPNYREGRNDNQPKLNLKKGKRYSKENIKQIVGQLIDLYGIAGEIYEYDMAVYKLTEHYELVRYAFDKLGERKLAELDYSITKIRQALIDYDVKQGLNKNPVIDSVYIKLPLKIKLPVDKIKKELQVIYDRYEIKATAKATDILQWFEAKATKIVTSTKVKDPISGDKSSKRVEQRAYILTAHKFNLHRWLTRT